VTVVSYNPNNGFATYRTPDGVIHRATVPPELRSFAAARAPGSKVRVSLTQAVAVSIKMPTPAHGARGLVRSDHARCGIAARPEVLTDAATPRYPDSAPLRDAARNPSDGRASGLGRGVSRLDSRRPARAPVAGGAALRGEARVAARY